MSEQEFDLSEHVMGQVHRRIRREVLHRAAESLRFVPLSQHISGQLTDYTQGMHAAADLLDLMAEDGE